MYTTPYACLPSPLISTNFRGVLVVGFPYNLMLSHTTFNWTIFIWKTKEIKCWLNGCLKVLVKRNPIYVSHHPWGPAIKLDFVGRHRLPSQFIIFLHGRNLPLLFVFCLPHILSLSLSPLFFCWTILSLLFEWW